MSRVETKNKTKKDSKKEPKKTEPRKEPLAGIIEERAVCNARDNYYDCRRALWLVGEICEEEQYDIIKWLHFFNDDSKRPVTIYINSYGGSIFTMNVIVDLINELKARGIEVTTVCLGVAMSAAAVILSAGSKGHRYASPNSLMMIHSVQSFGGDTQLKTKDVINNAKLTERIQTNMETLLADFTGKSLREIKKAVEYESYMSAEEAVKFGLIDHVETIIV